MFVLRIEHPVPDLEGWRRAFETDPVGRARHGVQRHRVLTDVDDPRFVMIDLDFATRHEAEVMLASLRGLWDRVEGSVMVDPRARIAESIDDRRYPPEPWRHE